MKISDLISTHEERRRNTVNLVASENLMSKAACEAMRSDLANRYCMPGEDDRPPGMWDYPNQAYTLQIAKTVQRYAREIFGGSYAEVRPLSGNNVAYIVLKSLVPSRGRVLSVPGDCGGHFTTAEICRAEGIDLHGLPFDRETGDVDLASLSKLIQKVKPHLVFLDASMQTFPYPLREIRQIVGEDVIISYDASHTMGLIAAGEFQAPFLEGADLLHGSTHKSLFGPQKGIIVCKNSLENSDNVARRIRDIVSPLFVSNMHIHNVAALGVVFEEMRAFGSQYAKQVVLNAKAFAGSLHSSGGQVMYADRGYTESHQVFCRIGNKDEMRARVSLLERANIHVNGVKIPCLDSFGLRFGLAEATRRGMMESHVWTLGKLVADCLFERRSNISIAKDVTFLSHEFDGIYYSFDS